MNSNDTFAKALSAVLKLQQHLVEEILSENKMDVRVQDEEGKTLLWYASKNGCSIMVNFLLEKGAEVDRSSKDGYTPLMIASLFGCRDVIKCLLKAGADATKQDKRGSTAYMIAMMRNDSVSAELVRTNTEDPNKLGEFFTVLERFRSLI